MLGTKSTEVFASRWKALRWSLGVLLLAYCTVPSADIKADIASSSNLPASTAAKPAADSSADDTDKIYKDYEAKLKALKVFEQQG
jgi:hypothetical protein